MDWNGTLKPSKGLRKRRKVSGPRMKRPDADPPTAFEIWHRERVRGLGCVVPDCFNQPVTIHHVRRRPDRKGLHKRDHQRIVGACRPHHLHDYGPDSVERIKESGFLAKFGIDLWEEGARLWAESLEIAEAA